MNKASLVVVLAEDQRHQRFVREYLYRLGYSARDIRMEALPAGRGCGEQWVRQRYAGAVGAYRARSSKAATALVVAIDADTDGLIRRCRQLEEALRNAKPPHRKSDEAIAHFIPQRSIETWILCLLGMAVDEDTDYRYRTAVDEKIRVAAETFYDSTRGGADAPEAWIPSLAAAVPEAKRIESQRPKN